MALKHLDEEILEKSMNLFWKKGYFNTSIQDLVEDTKINRATIYRNFKDKEGLFAACLEMYLQKITLTATESLSSETKSINNLKTFYLQFLNENHIFRTQGCLMMITISDAPLHGDIINNKITYFTQELQRLIYENITVDICKSKKEQMACMLLAHTFGVLSLMRCQNTEHIIKQQILGILQVLENLEQKHDKD
jgi:AcrR family transcriptional regulator